MKKIIRALVFLAYLGLLALPALAGENRVKIYDQNYHYQMQVDGDRVLDKNYKTKYHLEGNKIYDENYRYQGKIENNKIYDRNERYQGKIEGNKVTTGTSGSNTT